MFPVSGLNYVGPTATAADDLMTQRAVTDLLDTGTTRSFALDRIDALSAPYATTDYVNLADNAFVAPSIVDTRDGLNLPLAAKGAPNGVATLDSSSYVPLAQCPNLGAGIMKGPYGITTQISADTTTASQIVLATIVLGATGVTFKPWAFGEAFVQQQSPNARAVLEMRIGDNTQTSYAAQTLIGAGYGQSGYTDFQPIGTEPVGASTGTLATAGFSPSTNWVITLWLTSSGGTSLVKNANITTCSAYLLRVSS